MATRSYHRMATSPPRPAKRWPLMLLVIAVIAGVAATVLLANEQRNFKTLAQFLGMPLSSPAAVQPAALKAGEAPRVSTPTPRWPWPGFATMPGPIEPAPTPADMCSTQAAGAHEIPAFAESEQGGWECSMLLDSLGANRSASLFLIARGPIHAPANNIYVKFNITDGKLDGDLAAQALAFFRLAASMPRDPSLTDRLSKMLTSKGDFYFFAGYQSLTFRQEAGAPGQYNLIGIDRTPKTAMGHPRRWPMERRTAISIQDTKVGRLPRLLTLPAGSD